MAKRELLRKPKVHARNPISRWYENRYASYNQPPRMVLLPYEATVLPEEDVIEINPDNLEDEDTNLYQIWMFPNKKNVKPRWDAKKFPKEPVEGQLIPLVTGFDNNHSDSLKIHQDAVIYAGRVNKGKTVKQTIDRDQAYILCSQGKIKINDIEIKKGDGAEITDLKNVEITSLEDSEILFIDLPR